MLYSGVEKYIKSASLADLYVHSPTPENPFLELRNQALSKF